MESGFGAFGENPGGSCQQILPSLNPGHGRGLGSWGGFVLQTAAFFLERARRTPRSEILGEKSACELGLKVWVKPLHFSG